MGLDQYAYILSQPEPNPDCAALAARLRHHWWNHHALDDFMLLRFRDTQAAPTGTDWNRVWFSLTEADLDALHHYITSGAMADDHRRHVGVEAPPYTDDFWAADLNFVAEAKIALAGGQTVLYTNGW